MFPSGSLNQAPRAPLACSATPSTVFTPGRSYSSNATPRPRNCLTTASTSSTSKLHAGALRRAREFRLVDHEPRPTAHLISDRRPGPLVKGHQSERACVELLRAVEILGRDHRVRTRRL